MNVYFHINQNAFCNFLDQIEAFNAAQIEAVIQVIDDIQLGFSLYPDLMSPKMKKLNNTMYYFNFYRQLVGKQFLYIEFYFDIVPGMLTTDTSINDIRFEQFVVEIR